MYNFLGQLIGIALRSNVFLSVEFPDVIWKALVGEALSESDLASYDEGVYAFVKKMKKLIKLKGMAENSSEIEGTYFRSIFSIQVRKKDAYRSY